MNRILFVLLFISTLSCKAQVPQECGMKSEWLKKLAENKEKVAVFKFNNNNQEIIEFHHCYQCPDAIVSFYDCEGNKICDQGGFLGSNTCPEFTITERIKLYPKDE